MIDDFLKSIQQSYIATEENGNTHYLVVRLKSDSEEARMIRQTHKMLLAVCRRLRIEVCDGEEVVNSERFFQPR